MRWSINDLTNGKQGLYYTNEAKDLIESDSIKSAGYREDQNP
jgi:hypothetical protein